MDDTGHVEFAKEIIKNLLRPMWGNVNWENSGESVHILNQPHPFFIFLLPPSIFLVNQRFSFCLYAYLFCFAFIF